MSNCICDCWHHGLGGPFYFYNFFWKKKISCLFYFRLFISRFLLLVTNNNSNSDYLPKPKWCVECRMFHIFEFTLLKILGRILRERFKYIFFNSRNVFITYIDPTISYDTMVGVMREICSFPRVHPFTIKWVDEEGDPCTIR